jgi:SNF2 family DNA or RNA helicase
VLNRKNLHEYQKRAVDFIKDNEKAALWIDMGLGKTISTLTALTDLIAKKKVKKALIVAPLRVAKHTWSEEIRNWDHIDLNYTILAGLTPANRKTAIYKDTPVHIINREMIPWLVEMLGQKWHYDCVVIDESSSFKSHASKRWKAFRKVLGKIKRMVQLTGTPAPNSLMDLWPQLYLLDKGERLENTRGKFLAKYCTTVGNPQWNQYEVKPDRADAIYNKVKDVVLRMSAKDYLELPERIDLTIEVDLPAKARKAYEDMKRDFIMMYESGEVLAVNAAVQVGKLLQICNGNAYTEDGDFVEIHKEKLNELEQIIEQAQEPVLVAYNYKSDLSVIQKQIPNAEVLSSDPTTIDRWNKGEIPVLLTHPASAGHGLNLQKGGNVIVWYGVPWSLELYQQFNARLHRQGQQKPVRIIHIVAKDSADESVVASLKNKDDSQTKLLKVVES